MRPILYLGLAGATACGEAVAPPDGAASTDGFEIRLDPASSTASASPVTRLIVDPIPPNPGSIRLFEGTLSAYHLGRVASGELPSTLLEREVSVQCWPSSGALVVAPEQILRNAETYSLAHAGGLLLEFAVGQSTEFADPVQRLWPTPGVSGEPRAIYCGGALPADLGETTEFEPGAVSARILRGVAPGVRERDCFILEASEPLAVGTVLQPPIAVAGVALDPAPLHVAVPNPSEHAECPAAHVRFGPGCARIGDDRLEIAPTEPLLWAVLGEGLAFAGPVIDAPLVIKGLEPGTPNDIEVTAFDGFARRWSGKLTLDTALRTEHIVINEVLANPAGAEPAQEWVELVNDGSQVVELEGWTLEDTGARVSLPQCALGPGSFALVVADAYDPSAAFDVPPSAETRLLRVESLGQDGLRNSGEPLALRDRDGVLRSSFPALGGTEEGFSAARKEPWAPDALESFAVHAEPGASPGATNETE